MEKMIDLSLVPIEDLCQEICNRTHYHVIGYSRLDRGEELFDVRFGGDYLKKLGLATQMVRDIQNSVEDK